jgi:hypothetical protein
MARLTGPLYSRKAHGAVGKALIYCNWRGIPYAKAYAVPTNPRTERQQSWRAVFERCVYHWHNSLEYDITESQRNAWIRRVNITALKMTGYNKFISTYIKFMDLNSPPASPICRYIQCQQDEALTTATFNARFLTGIEFDVTIFVLNSIGELLGSEIKTVPAGGILNTTIDLPENFAYTWLQGNDLDPDRVCESGYSLIIPLA